MSGHSHWASIKHKKAAADARRGKVISKMIKQIFVAVRDGGPDPDTNPGLRLLVQKARQDGVAKDSVERAILRASGKSPDGAGQMEELTYEAYAPGGAALLISAVTDNRNRTGPDLRHILERRGGKMAAGGSVAWMFKRKGVVTVSAAAASEDRLMELLLDAGAEDIEAGAEYHSVTTAPADYPRVLKALEAAGIATDAAELRNVAESTIQLSGGDARRTVGLIQELDDHDDVSSVDTNFEMTAELAAELAKE